MALCGACTVHVDGVAIRISNGDRARLALCTAPARSL
jgi:aerobic-type carbon monoxide dehydrogenase small subunit (CoxS/CutS family)